MAFTAAESCPPSMNDLDSDLLVILIELDVTDRPWRGHAKNVLVYFFVLYLGVLFPTIQSLPTQNPDGPKFLARFLKGAPDRNEASSGPSHHGNGVVEKNASKLVRKRSESRASVG